MGRFTPAGTDLVLSMLSLTADHRPGAARCHSRLQQMPPVPSPPSVFETVLQHPGSEVGAALTLSQSISTTDTPMIGNEYTGLDSWLQTNPAGGSAYSSTQRDTIVGTSLSLRSIPSVVLDSVHAKLVLEDHEVLVRRKDGYINVSQILVAAGVLREESMRIYRLLNANTTVETHPPHRKLNRQSWVNIHHGRLLCDKLAMTASLQPLIDYGVAIQSQQPQAHDTVTHDYLMDDPSFIIVHDAVHVSRHDMRVNASNILEAAGLSREEMRRLKRRLDRQQWQYLYGSPQEQGTYVDFDVGVGLCKKYGLDELAASLSNLKDTQDTHLKPPADAVLDAFPTGTVRGTDEHAWFPSEQTARYAREQSRHDDGHGGTTHMTTSRSTSLLRSVESHNVTI